MHSRIARIGPSVAVLSAFAAACPAATITWSAANNITGEGNVNTVGSLVASANFGAAGTTAANVNTVPFPAFAITNGTNNLTVGNVNLTETNGKLASFNQTITAAPFTGLTPAYQNLLAGYASSSAIESLRVTVNNLTAGQLYSVQAFVNLSSAFAANTSVQVVGGPVLDVNTTDANGGLGQYANGKFIADSTSQAFFINGFGGDPGDETIHPYLNAFQMRAVPEPTGLVALAGVAAIAVRRRRT